MLAFHSQSYMNNKNGRQYRMDIYEEDLLGDTILTRYFGCHRLTTVHENVDSALIEFRNIDTKRKKRGYLAIWDLSHLENATVDKLRRIWAPVGVCY